MVSHEYSSLILIIVQTSSGQSDHQFFADLERIGILKPQLFVNVLTSVGQPKSKDCRHHLALS